MRPTDEKKFDSLFVNRPPLKRNASNCAEKHRTSVNMMIDGYFMSNGVALRRRGAEEESC
jgi:hypothetical protein